MAWGRTVGTLQLCAVLAASACDSSREDGDCAGGYIETPGQWTALADMGCTVIQGDLSVLAVDPARPSPVVRVAGRLYLGGPGMASTPFPVLESADLVAAKPGLVELSLPALRSGELMLESPELTTVNLPALTTGSVSVWGADALTTLSLPALQTVTADGFHIVVAASLSTISLPALTTVQGDLILAPLDTVDLPQLVTVGGALSLGGTSVSLHALESIGGTLYVIRAPLPALSLPALTSIGGDLFISQNASLATLGLPALRTTGGNVLLQLLPALAALDLGDLATVGGGATVANTGLAALELPALTSVNCDTPYCMLSVADNADLTSMSAPLLSSVGGDFRVIDNAKLPQCEAEALRNQLTTLAGAANITGNNTIATCP